MPWEIETYRYKISFYPRTRQQSKINIELKYCPTNNMIADMLTKGLGKETFEKLRTLAGLSKQSSFK